MAPLRNFRLQSTYVIIPMKNKGITTQGTIGFIWLFVPLLLLPILACEDEVAEREEEVGVDVED